MEFLNEPTLSETNKHCGMGHSVIHKSLNGCTMIKGLHRFNKIDVDIDIDGMLLINNVDFNSKYYYKFFRNGSVQFDTELGPSFKHICDYVSGSLNKFKEALTHIYMTYHSKIEPVMNGKHLSVQSLFDCAFTGDNRMIFLRPLKFSDDSTFYAHNREVFFKLLSCFMNKNKIEGTSREGKACNAEFFTGARCQAPEFKCAYNSYDSCQHRYDNMIEGKLIRHRPAVLCKYLIRAYVEEFHDSADQILGFKCKFAELDDEHPGYPSSAIYAYQHIYKRRSMIHRMCIPTRFISKMWYEYYQTEILDIEMEEKIEDD